MYNAAEVDFNRYEAEDAWQEGSSVMRDRSMSGGAKSRLGALDVGTLTFEVHVSRGSPHTLRVEYMDIGFEAVPRLWVDGQTVTGSVAPVELDPEVASRRSGMNTIEVRGGDYALDVDYLEVTPTP